jgi:plasmid stabilization system protein ParE
MKYEVIFKRLAEEDLTEAYDWLYHNKSPELAERFLDATDIALDYIENNPLVLREREEGLRVVFAKPFPHSIYYLVHENKVLIYAVLHGHRSHKPILEERI